MNKQNKTIVNWQTIFVFVILLAGISFVFSIFQVPKYKSSVRILVVPQFASDTDPYAATRSVDYVTNILNKVIYSTSFFNKVMNSGFGVVNEFDANPVMRAKQWQKTVHSVALNNAGILEVSVLNPNQSQSQSITNALAYVLVNQGYEYHGVSQVKVKVIDPAATSGKPVLPNIPLNVLIGALLGLMGGVGFVYLFPQYNFNVVDVMVVNAKDCINRYKNRVKNKKIQKIKSQVSVKPGWAESLPAVSLSAPIRQNGQNVVAKQVGVVKEVEPPKNLPTIRQRLNIL